VLNLFKLTLFTSFVTIGCLAPVMIWSVEGPGAAWKMVVGLWRSLFPLKPADIPLKDRIEVLERNSRELHESVRLYRAQAGRLEAHVYMRDADLCAHAERLDKLEEITYNRPKVAYGSYPSRGGDAAPTCW
jgi:hypothetical protein